MEEINLINSNILSLLKDNSSLEIANAIMSKLSPLPSFLKIAKEIYSSEVHPLRNVEQINKWSNIKTHGKITKIVDNLPLNIFMIILNAVYFKGQWVKPFEKYIT